MLFKRSASGFVLAGACVALAACPAVDGDDAELVELGNEVDGPALREYMLKAPFGFRPLSQEPVPQPIGGHIIDQAAAIRLGKALFWDTQASGDGEVACATCHAAAGGVDDRRFHTIHPGLDNVFASGGVTGPGQLYTPELIVNDDIVGSQGVKRRVFQSLNPDPAIANENCASQVDPQFADERRIEFRQSATVFGAVFHRELFWAGEAKHEFNGLNIFGFAPNNTGGSITNIGNAALASQSVGPPANGTEMRCGGRPINGVAQSLAAKMLARPPLQFQQVSTTDSVLGALANPSGPGLRCGDVPCTYRGMIEAAFGPDLAANAETVFSMVWGEAIQAYESTLIPDQTPFDRFLSGDFTALTLRQLFGLARFVGKANCVACHRGAMLTDATLRHFEEFGPLNRDGGDQGFHNIGLANSELDRGRGSTGGGAPHSVSGSPFDNFAFKTPSLRNVKLTAPYFHTGSYPTLEHVVEFFNRGGDFANPERSADIKPLHLTAFDKAALIDFLRNGLTDCRVEKRQAPFDHPSLVVANGPSLPAVGAAGTGPCGGGPNTLLDSE